MNAQDAVAPRDPLQREGQGQLQDPERPLFFCVAEDAVWETGLVDGGSDIPRRVTRVTEPSESNRTLTVALPVTGDGRKLSNSLNFTVSGPEP